MRRIRAPWAAHLAALGAVCLFATTGIATTGHASIAEGDAAWARRAEVLEGERAAPERIEEAIRLYRVAVEVAPDSAEARWKLLRAFHYAVDFTTLPGNAQDAILTEAIELARASQDLMGEGADVGTADRARLLFWSSIVWGTRAQRVGLLTVVREGAAKRMHDEAQRSLDLDPSVDDGGAYRLLSRLHAKLPRVPFVSGWVDRDRALPLAEAGYARDPDHPGNRVVLALTILDRAPKREDEARELLERVATSEPRAAAVAEDLRIRAQARERLAELGGPTS